MSSNNDMPFLKRCGLTFAKLAEVMAAPDSRRSLDGRPFSIYMLNDVKFADCARPSVPTARGRLELLRVEICDDVLTIANIVGERRKDCGTTSERVGARLYARKTIAMEGATVFMLLSEPPVGVTDDKFFPADGSVVLYEDDHYGPRILKACGIDRNSGQCAGWIFHAVET